MGPLVSAPQTTDVFNYMVVALSIMGLWSCAAQPPQCTCATSGTTASTTQPAATSQTIVPAETGNTVTTGYFYAVDGDTTTWRTCGTDNVITAPTSKIVSAVRGGTCVGVIYGYNPKYTITVRP
jgi:hypothetical protein